MKNIKTYLKYLGVTLIIILLGLLLISTLYYFDIISSNVVSYIRIIFIMLVMFIMSYILGKNTEKNGYLAGIKYGLMNIGLFLILGLLFFRDGLQLRLILYDFILLFTSVLGSMIGINKKKNY
ncbi:MAG: TIGR04086 family membrane protein [Bacilli bacterium]|nr:TIGR04086 family membrane protein [Bacilli bacterium]